MENETPKILTTAEVIESAKNELRATAPQKAVEELVASAKAVVVTDYNDQDGIKAADAKRKELKAIRTAIERKRKELKEVATKYGKEVDGTAKTLSSPIEAEETRIENMLEDLEKKRKADAERAEREALEKFNARVDEIRAIGAKYDGAYWQLGRAKIAPERIKAYDDVAWHDLVLAKFREEADRLAEEERKQKEREESARRLEEENARLKAELEEFRRMKEAMQAKSETQIGVSQERLQEVVEDVKATFEELEKAFPVVPAQVERPVFEPVPVVEGDKVVTAPSVSFGPPRTIPAHIAEQNGTDRQGNPIEPAAENNTESATNEPKPQPEQPEPEPSASEVFLAHLLKSEGPGATHFRGGYRQGVSFAKRAVMAILADTAMYNTRAKVKEAIEAL